MRDPLIKAIHDSAVAYEDVEEYLHAPSRNAAMRAINPTEEELKALRLVKPFKGNNTALSDISKRRIEGPS